MRWRDPSEWVVAAERTHEPLITPEVASLVAGRMAVPNPGGQRRPRVSTHPYCLRGLLCCSRCGARMQGSWRPGRTEGAGRLLYRCEIKHRRALPPELADHPSTLYVQEEAIFRYLDPWVESLARPEALTSSQADDPVAFAKRAGLHAQLGDIDRKIANLMLAIESGGDPKLLMDQLAKRNAEREALKARIAMAAGPAALTTGQVVCLLQAFGGISGSSDSGGAVLLGRALNAPRAFCQRAPSEHSERV